MILTMSSLTFIVTLIMLLATPKNTHNETINSLKWTKEDDNQWTQNNFQTWSSETSENHSVFIEGIILDQKACNCDL